MPDYEVSYEWTCPRCGTYISEGYHCTACFYAPPRVPKQRASLLAILLAVGCVLLLLLGLWLTQTPAKGLAATLIVVGALLGWAAAKI